MKTVLTTLCLLLVVNGLWAQKKKQFEQSKRTLLKQIDSLKRHKPLDEYNGQWIAKLEKEFYIDTFYIERLWSLEMDYDYSTLGMNQATYRAEIAYDKLLNKYYKKLYDQLEGSDKEKLKTSQKNWIRFRDSEKELNYTLYNEKYSGGGTIHKIFVANKSAEITKQRVIELYFYLNRIWQPKTKR